MQAIEISREQLDQLFEMCNHIFPEQNWQWGDHFRRGHIDIYDHGTKLMPTTPIYRKSIHWFEFCLNVIPKHMKNSEGELYFGDGSANEVLKMMERGIHPIDYLYSQFEKLRP